MIATALPAIISYYYSACATRQCIRCTNSHKLISKGLLAVNLSLQKKIFPSSLFPPRRMGQKSQQLGHNEAFRHLFFPHVEPGPISHHQMLHYSVQKSIRNRGERWAISSSSRYSIHDYQVMPRLIASFVFSVWGPATSFVVAISGCDGMLSGFGLYHQHGHQSSTTTTPVHLPGHTVVLCWSRAFQPCRWSQPKLTGANAESWRCFAYLELYISGFHHPFAHFIFYLHSCVIVFRLWSAPPCVTDHLWRRGSHWIAPPTVSELSWEFFLVFLEGFRLVCVQAYGHAWRKKLYPVRNGDFESQRLWLNVLIYIYVNKEVRAMLNTHI